MKARIRIYSGYGDRTEVLDDFLTRGKPPYGMGFDRDPERANLFVSTFEAPHKGYHVADHQLMVWHNYAPKERRVSAVTVPPGGRIEITAEPTETP